MKPVCICITVGSSTTLYCWPNVTTIGEPRLNAMKRFFCICSLRSYLNVLTVSPLTGGYSEGLDAFRFSLIKIDSRIRTKCEKTRQRNFRE